MQESSHICELVPHLDKIQNSAKPLLYLLEKHIHNKRKTRYKILRVVIIFGNGKKSIRQELLAV